MNKLTEPHIKILDRISHLTETDLRDKVVATKRGGITLEFNHRVSEYSSCNSLISKLLKISKQYGGFSVETSGLYQIFLRLDKGSK